MAVELTDEVEDLARDSGQQFTSLARTARKNRIMIWGLVASVGLDVVITVVLALVGLTTVNNTDRLNQITGDIQDEQTDQRRRALCPLYGILKDAESPEGKERSALPPDEYDHAFKVINDGYVFLGCDTFLEESGGDRW